MSPFGMVLGGAGGRKGVGGGGSDQRKAGSRANMKTADKKSGCSGRAAMYSWAQSGPQNGSRARPQESCREEYAMRSKSALMTAALGIFGTLVLATTLHAQGAGGPGAPWRGAGAQPCYGPDGGAFQCPPAPQALAVRASRLLDTKTGQIATRQAVLIQGERTTEARPRAQVKIPAGAQATARGPAPLPPGLSHAHTQLCTPPQP